MIIAIITTFSYSKCSINTVRSEGVIYLPIINLILITILDCEF